MLKLMYRSIVYSVKNVLLHRVERTPSAVDIYRNIRTDDIYAVLTNYMLTSLGLIITNKPDKLKGIYLTKKQRQVAEKACSVGGYYVDVLWQKYI